MATALYVQRGDSIDYTPSSNVASGDVVALGSIIGIAKLDIPTDTLGALSVTGVFSMPKAEATVFTQGADVFWDEENGVCLTTLQDATRIGVAIAAAPADTTSVKVKINI